MRRPSFSLPDGGDTLNLNEEIGVEEAFDDNQRAGRQFAMEDAAAYLGHGWEIFELGDVGGNLEQIGQVTASGLQHAAQVVKYLPGLGADVSRTDNMTRGIPRHLPGDIQETATLHTRGHFIVGHRLGFGWCNGTVWHALSPLGHR